MDALVTTPCSQASLAQRAGRAGRTSPGKCFRLFPESVVSTLLPTTPPEITRSDISLLVLQLKSLGIQNVLRFDWMTAPSSTMLERALEFLYCLGALDEEGKLTKPLGVRMAEMPIDCMMAKIVSRYLYSFQKAGPLTRHRVPRSYLTRPTSNALMRFSQSRR
jgi:ATP-dependent RNA helicase DDX35